MTQSVGTILILSWRDIRSEKHGGAEIYTHEIFKRLVHYGWEIDHLSPRQAGLPEQEEIEGIRYIRRGNIFTVIGHAVAMYYRTRHSLVVDQCNTHRFFTPFWLHKALRVFLIYQLTREIWHYNLPLPFSFIGQKTENLLLKLYRNTSTITISHSTAQDLIDLGFKPDDISIVPNGFTVPKQSRFTEKECFTFVYLGRFSTYKRIDHVIQAFAILKKKYQMAKLWLIGKPDDNLMNNLLLQILAEHNLILGYPDTQSGDVILWGYVDEAMKNSLLSQSKALIFPALREGWGRTISEAALYGTPSIVYNAPGVIDAVDFGNAGFVAEEDNPQCLADQMQLVIENDMLYTEIQQNAFNYTKQFTWESATELMNKIFTQKVINNQHISK